MPTQEKVQTTAAQERLSLEDHVRRRFTKWTRQLRRNWLLDTRSGGSGATLAPVETVHDLRVASRRLRAFLDVIDHALGHKTRHALDKRLKRVARAVGPVRDWDVLIADVQQRHAAVASDFERATLEHLLERFSRKRARAEKDAIKRLRKIDGAALYARLHACFDEATQRSAAPPLASFARGLIELRISEALETAPPRDGREHIDEMHRLRIAVKKLRYALELFEPAVSPRHARLHERAVVMQEMLGKHHDLCVLGSHVKAELAELRDRDRNALVKGLDMLVNDLFTERMALVARYQQTGLERRGPRSTTSPGNRLN